MDIVAPYRPLPCSIKLSLLELLRQHRLLHLPGSAQHVLYRVEAKRISIKSISNLLSSACWCVSSRAAISNQSHLSSLHEVGAIIFYFGYYYFDTLLE